MRTDPDWPTRLDRHHRHVLAERAGWTLEELAELGRGDRLPTYTEILRRNFSVFIAEWYNNSTR